MGFYPRFSIFYMGFSAFRLLFFSHTQKHGAKPKTSHRRRILLRRSYSIVSVIRQTKWQTALICLTDNSRNAAS